MLAFAPCKINIGLDIVAKRTDGYHDIETVMVPVGWCDIVEIVPSTSHDTTLTVLGNKVDCPTEQNLVTKAYRALQALFGLPSVDIVLQKIVPDGAGLGGGSSDASTTLKILNQLFNLGLPNEKLAEIAATLGADCPFFIYDEPMLCSGIGTTMRPFPINLKGYTLLIAKPSDVAISTKQAYSGVMPQKPDTPLAQLLTMPIEQWQGKVKNDFEKSIFALAPKEKATKQTMLAHGAVYASMSGSGASIYGFFTDRASAEKCQTVLSNCKSWIGEV